MKINTVFFDLDETIWDYRANAEDTLIDLFYNNNLNTHFSLEDFIKIFFEVNRELWDLFDQKKIDKSVIRERRFKTTLERLDSEDTQLGSLLQDQFMAQCPQKTKVFPNAVEVIDKLSGHFDLHIITNGFENIQHHKLKSAGVGHHFKELITSEMAGAQKPDPKIFNLALKKANSVAQESVMIGNNLFADVMGARNVGMEAIYFNPEKELHTENIQYEVNDLCQILDIVL